MNIAPYIDHTVLKSATTLADIEKICTEAKDFRFATVCVPPYYVRDAKQALKGSDCGVTTVIGFPFGYSHYSAKMKEAEQALNDGADELDLVMNIAAFKNNDLAYLETEIGEIIRIKGKATLKVIIESGILSDEEIIKCCNLYKHYPVNFLKTSTGYAEKGATIEAVQLMRQHLPSSIQIKASGGIKTFDFARQMIDAGATRLGCSASVAIVKGSDEASEAGY